MTAVMVAVAGALLAELAAPAIGYPASATVTKLLWVRAAVLLSAAGMVGIVLVDALRVALLRAQIQSHAETERQLHEAKSAADEASRAKSDFLAVMSHEIRTPLNAVMGFANLLSATRLDDSQRGYVATITSEGSRLTGIINDILDLTKLEKGRLVLERVPFAPVEIAHEVLRLFSARATEKRIDLRLEAQVTEPLAVGGDPLRFRQVLVNLIDNALKFTPAGAVTVFMAWVPPVGSQPNGILKVRVCDTGIGIAPEKVQHLFQMFMQADTSTTRRFGGTGLGLAICQRLVRLMGGEIVVQSQPGVGTEFKFTLPMATVALPESEKALPEPEVVLGRPPRILVVDDMETNRFLLEVYLRRHGFDPHLAGGGEEAVRMAAESRYDAILMDLQMPGIDGYTATQRIRAAEPPHQRTPIIALTASVGKGTRERCLAAGMNEHLMKPLDLPKFRALLSRFVQPRVERPVSSPSP